MVLHSHLLTLSIGEDWFRRLCTIFLLTVIWLKAEKIQNGDKINVYVPTGNFGNILAAYYARRNGTSG